MGCGPSNHLDQHVNNKPVTNSVLVNKTADPDHNETKQDKEVIAEHSLSLKRAKSRIKRTLTQFDLRKDKTATKQKLDRNTKFILKGNLYVDFPSTAKIVRIFTSSTFTDTQHERNYLMENTYPRLKEFCQNLGYEFQIVDMRWGVREEAMDDHMTTELCLKEVDLCNKLSTGPSFVTFLSHKYGYRDFPREIEAGEFELLLSKIESKENKSLLNKWFIRDDNSVPPTYVLQPISSHLPDFISSDVDQKKQAKDTWNKQHEQMRESLVTSAKQALDTSAAHKYLRSVTEAEIDRGIPEEGKRAFWFDRQIKDIDRQEASYILSRYKECKGKKEYLLESRRLLENLRNNKLKHKLPVDHIKKYTIDWTEHGVDPTKEESHRLYISKLADDFERSIKDGIKRAIQEKQSNVSNNTICQEVIQHINFCKHKCHSFYGRKDTFDIINDYLTNNSDEPLVIHGSSGCGKTSIVAMSAKNTFDTKNGEKHTIVMRFLGTTPDSSNISALLYSVISQIKLVYEEEPIKQGLSLKDLTEEFHLSLEHARKRRPMLVLLDSLDQLDTTGGARQLSWLPRNLPEYVKMIVSTLPEAEYECFPKLQAMFSTPSCFLPVETLSNDDVEGILHKWLETKQRKLLDSQLKIVLEAFHQCPLPLFLKLSFDEACRWKSFTPPSVSTLQTTVRNVINDLFIRVESLHGQLLVSRALGYLTLSGGGLTETELEDILSCDDDVLNDVYMYWTPPIRRLPPLLLVRIKAELGQYFVDRGADGVRVFYWYHRQFIEAATDRYCSDINIKEKMCGVIADFFSGIWANGKTKPFKTRSGEASQADRYVTSQPVKLGESYNLRKLNNLPHHRQQANQLDLLKLECLCNFNFILHKIKASGLRPVLDDFSSAKEQFVDDEDIKSICDALQLSQRSLQYNSNELPSQLLGRLKPTKSLQPLLDDCKNSPFYYLLPDKTILAQPGGSLLYCLSNHTGDIQGLDITKDGELAVTCATDRTIKTWSVKSGKLVRSYDLGVEDLEHVKLCHNDQILVASGTKFLVGVNFLTGVKLYEIPTESKSNFCVAGEDKDVLGIFKGKCINVYNAASGELNSQTKCQFLKEDMDFEEYDFCVGQGRYMAGMDNENYSVAIFDVTEEKFLHVTTIYPEYKDEDGDLMRNTVDAMAISPDEKNIVIFNYSDNKTGIYDIKTMKEIKVLTRYAKGSIEKLQFTPDGKYLYVGARNDVVVFNLETDETFVAVHHPTSVNHVITLDMNSVVTVGDDRIVRIYDRSKDNGVTNKETQQNTTKKVDMGSPVLIDNPRYIITRYKQNQSYYLQIYDLATNRVVKTSKLLTPISYVLSVDDTRCLLQHGKKVSLLDLQTTSIIRTYQGHESSKASSDPVINSTKTEFYTLSRGRMNIKKYNIETGECQIIKGCGEKLGDYLVNKTGTVLAASVHDDEWVVFFDLVNKQVMYQLKPEMMGSDIKDDSIYLNDGLVTDDGRYLIFQHSLVPPGLDNPGDYQSTYLVMVWCIPDKKLHKILYDEEYFNKYHEMDKNKTDDEEIPDISVDALYLLDDNTLITSNDDNILRVYDIDTGNLLHRLTGHFSHVMIVLNKDSPFFLTYANWSEENCIRLWDKQTFECLTSYCIETKMKTPMFTSDGYCLMAIDNDLGYIKFDLQGGEKISKYQPPKQLEQYEEVFKPIDDIVELTIPDTVLFDTPDPDTDESDVTTDDSDDDDDKKNDGANKQDDDLDFGLDDLDLSKDLGDDLDFLDDLDDMSSLSDDSTGTDKNKKGI
ncbi:hypothetical protein SNE40_017384 [Patella caerulea]|uniref:Uncharacterized protein n=1 Tax=Patella caerulea TaxID=87958 RepID=A0AAN8JH06_PATCE